MIFFLLVRIALVRAFSLAQDLSVFHFGSYLLRGCLSSVPADCVWCTQWVALTNAFIIYDIIPREDVCWLAAPSTWYVNTFLRSIVIHSAMSSMQHGSLRIRSHDFIFNTVYLAYGGIERSERPFTPFFWFDDDVSRFVRHNWLVISKGCRVSRCCTNRTGEKKNDLEFFISFRRSFTALASLACDTSFIVGSAQFLRILRCTIFVIPFQIFIQLYRWQCYCSSLCRLSKIRKRLSRLAYL